MTRFIQLRCNLCKQVVQDDGAFLGEFFTFAACSGSIQPLAADVSPTEEVDSDVHICAPCALTIRDEIAALALIKKESDDG
jgi:hypothetical protein